VVESLTTPYLLLAAPVMLDPNFQKTVVVMGHHTREGALGWVVNRFLGEPAISLLAPPLDAAIHPETPLRVGGPIFTNGLVALFAEEMPGVESVEMAPGLRVSVAAEILPKLFAAPPKSRTTGLLILGYSGWAADQLESEMEEGTWLVLPWDPALVFTHDVEGLWERALARLGVDPGSVSTSTGVS
jgi:putative transcriptional regulator